MNISVQAYNLEENEKREKLINILSTFKFLTINQNKMKRYFPKLQLYLTKNTVIEGDLIFKTFKTTPIVPNLYHFIVSLTRSDTKFIISS